jgi:hypothetical protein
MNMTDKQRADVVRTLRKAAEYMGKQQACGMCGALVLCHATFETQVNCHIAFNWLQADSTRRYEDYWYAAPLTEHEARAFALDMLASIIEAGDSLE